MSTGQTHVSGVTWGTPLYMAPEILATGRSSTAADVFAFGVMLWELYHGQLVWAKVTAGNKHLKQDELTSVKASSGGGSGAGTCTLSWAVAWRRVAC